MTIFGREPAFWIGLGVTLILGVVQTLSGSGVISDAIAGKITDGTNAISQAALLLLPLITGLLIRQTVTPVAAPALPQGTKVEVITPGNAANTTATL